MPLGLAENRSLPGIFIHRSFVLFVVRHRQWCRVEILSTEALCPCGHGICRIVFKKFGHSCWCQACFSQVQATQRGSELASPARMGSSAMRSCWYKLKQRRSTQYQTDGVYDWNSDDTNVLRRKVKSYCCTIKPDCKFLCFERYHLCCI